APRCRLSFPTRRSSDLSLNPSASRSYSMMTLGPPSSVDSLHTLRLLTGSHEADNGGTKPAVNTRQIVRRRNIPGSQDPQCPRTPPRDLVQVCVSVAKKSRGFVFVCQCCEN